MSKLVKYEYEYEPRSRGELAAAGRARSAAVASSSRVRRTCASCRRCALPPPTGAGRLWAAKFSELQSTSGLVQKKEPKERSVSPQVNTAEQAARARTEWPHWTSRYSRKSKPPAEGVFRAVSASELLSNEKEPSLEETCSPPLICNQEQREECAMPRMEGPQDLNY